MNENLTVGTISLYDLLSNNLEIPEYQRPYEWNQELAEKLFTDIDKHFFPNGEAIPIDKPFYCGSVLLNKDEKEEKYFVIDGQQRLTTFLILDFVIKGNDSILVKEENICFEYRNQISVNTIKKIQNYLNSDKRYFVFTKYFPEIQKNITLNCVITYDENKAFRFFDSLNSTGKKLDLINIFKSEHLRYLQGAKTVQEQQASIFDKINSNIENDNFRGTHKIYSLNHFIVIFWVRHYYWTRGDFGYIDESKIKKFFKDNSIGTDRDSQLKLKLYPGIRNQGNSKASIDDSLVLQPEKSFDVNDNVVYEFNPLHPIQKGLGFFLSIDSLRKYFTELFGENNKINKINELVRNSSNQYFIRFYYLCVLAYYIKFGNENLKRFAFEMERFLGYWYVSLNSVRRESPHVILSKELNILQQIYLNVDSRLLINEIENYNKKNRIKKIEYIEDNKIRVNDLGKLEYSVNTTRPKYLKKAVEIYFNKDDKIELKEYLEITWDVIKENIQEC